MRNYGAVKKQRQTICTLPPPERRQQGMDNKTKRPPDKRKLSGGTLADLVWLLTEWCWRRALRRSWRSWSWAVRAWMLRSWCTLHILFVDGVILTDIYTNVNILQQNFTIFTKRNRSKFNLVWNAQAKKKTSPAVSVTAGLNRLRSCLKIRRAGRWNWRRPWRWTQKQKCREPD